MIRVMKRYFLQSFIYIIIIQLIIFSLTISGYAGDNNAFHTITYHNNNIYPMVTDDVFVDIDLDSSSFFHDDFSVFSKGSAIIENTDDNVVNLINDLKEELTIGYIENITSFGPRPTGSISCDDSAKYIYHEFKKMGLEVRYQNWTHTSSYAGSNIEATLYGCDPTSDEIYIVCGHYDTVRKSPGADDNGAGTALVLGLAEIMSKQHFNHTVRFVAFSGEEEGKIGSHYYVTEVYANNDNIIAVLNADMMGYAASSKGEHNVVVYDNGDSKWLTEYTTQISELYHEYIGLEIIEGGQSGRSDHASFYAGGYSAIFYHEYQQNPYYHTSKDTLETMNTRYANNVSKLALVTLASLAEFKVIHPPEQPTKPIGIPQGKPGETYLFSSYTIDNDSDDLYYLWDWGDGTINEWIGPYGSGEVCEVDHLWEEEGTYAVKVKARDEHGEESPWSEPSIVSMPKIIDTYPRIHSIIMRLFEGFLR